MHNFKNVRSSHYCRVRNRDRQQKISACLLNGAAIAHMVSPLQADNINLTDNEMEIFRKFHPHRYFGWFDLVLENRWQDIVSK